MGTLWTGTGSDSTSGCVAPRTVRTTVTPILADIAVLRAPLLSFLPAPSSRHGAIVAQGPRCGVSRAQNRRQEQVRVVIGAADEPLWAFPPLAAKCLPGQECVAFHDLVSTQSLSKMSLLPVFA